MKKKGGIKRAREFDLDGLESDGIKIVKVNPPTRASWSSEDISKITKYFDGF